MTGDGTNDRSCACSGGRWRGHEPPGRRQAKKEAGNMVDLDSNPTKLIEIVEIGKQLLITRGAADDVFPVANDGGQVFRDYFRRCSRGAFPVLNVLNVMHLRNARNQPSYPR